MFILKFDNVYIDFNSSFDDLCWYSNDDFHRENGPACEYIDGRKYWYLNGKLHREDGPAVEFAEGSLWYLNGKLVHDVTKEEVIICSS